MTRKKAKELYSELPKPVVMPKKREGTYLPDNILWNLIEHIENPVHRDISKLRYYTGIRAAEALTIKEEKLRRIHKSLVVDNVRHDLDLLQIIIKPKGQPERPIFLDIQKAAKIIKPHIQNLPGFLFIPREWSQYEESNAAMFWTKIQSARRALYRSQNDAARKIGLKLKYGTHDIRRSFIDKTEQKLQDPRQVQKV